MFRPAVRQAQAAPKRAARAAAVARPTPRPTAPVLRAPALNMFARRAALHAPLQRVPAEATHRAEAITEATAPAVPTTEAAVQRQEAPLQLLAAAQVAATAAEAVARVRAAAIAQAVAAAVREAVEATVRAVEAVRAAVEEDKFQPKLQI